MIFKQRMTALGVHRGRGRWEKLDLRGYSTKGDTSNRGRDVSEVHPGQVRVTGVSQEDGVPAAIGIPATRTCEIGSSSAVVPVKKLDRLVK